MLHKNNRKYIEAEIPTASMADIAFLLIVFFMLTTVFSANAGMEHRLGQSEEQGRPEDSVYLHIQSETLLLFDGQPLPLQDQDAVLNRLNPIMQSNPNKPIILRTDADVPYGAMITVLDHIHILEASMGSDIHFQVTVPSPQERAVMDAMAP